ncbi:hypothetical protein PIN31115_04497 [Pandoraea iniqua]|uniref:SepL/TyeA/HrpJ family type III secretion system gatekeeper n=1 Tax=Pandoraea iniqua TaxID=2508288 RepID=A0A5E4YJ31_9BURK|nr:type III secretion system gatekeeper subunit SctW [Pandoraea iniqua]VVE47993.1 hypothetical protein PIN31115_04497 [Pandoraea iniqua]
MLSRVDHHSLRPTPLVPNSAAAALPKGGLRGVTARAAAEAQSVLKRSGAKWAQAAGSRSKSLNAERRVRGAKISERPTHEEIEGYFGAFSDDPSVAHARTATQQQCFDGDDPRQSAQQWFESPAEQYLALEAILLQPECRDEKIRDRIEDALADLLAEHGEQIRAGLNSIGAASQFSTLSEGGAKEVRNLQSTYQDIVFDTKQSLAQVLNTLLARFPGQSLSHAITCLRRALGDDLAAQNRSIDEARLCVLNNDLFYVSVATTALLDCSALIERLTAPNATPLTRADHTLMRNLASWTLDRWVPASRVSELANTLGIDSTQQRITLMGGMRAVLAKFPVQVFQDTEHRFTVLDAAQQALDTAIETENAELDAQLSATEPNDITLARETTAAGSVGIANDVNTAPPSPVREAR